MDKIDFKKEFSTKFNPSSKAVQITSIPKFNYLMIDGQGDPNTSQEYRDAIEALFSVSYAIKFMKKRELNGIDYGVLPLEGIWWTDNVDEFSMENKANWHWTALIMQPSFVDEALVLKALEEVKKKKGFSAISKIRFQGVEEGLVAQIMHIGPYSEEKPIIDNLHNFIEKNGYVKIGKHHEIYLSDPRKASPDKMKTIIRQPIASK